jgi:EpsI family protein
MHEPKAHSMRLRTGLMILTAVLGAQVFFSYSSLFAERHLNSPGLQMLPTKMGNWIAVGDQAMEADVEEYLKPDEYLMRAYRHEDGGGDISLFVAYFKSLQSGYGPHAPNICLPGSGWLTRMQRSVMLPMPGKPEGIPINEYALEKNGEQILVLYWYQNDRRVWANELSSRVFLTPDLLRYRRSDVALVRVILPMGRETTIEKPLQYSVDFIRDLFPQLAERFAATG